LLPALFLRANAETERRPRTFEGWQKTLPAAPAHCPTSCLRVIALMRATVTEKFNRTVDDTTLNTWLSVINKHGWKFQPTIGIAVLRGVLAPATPAVGGRFVTKTLTTHSIQRGAFAFALLASFAAAQAVQVERVEKDSNVLFSGGEYMSLYTLGKLDHRRQEQVVSNSEATVSKFDLKAPGGARNEYSRGLRFLAKNDFKSAVASLQKAISIYPSFVAVHSALGCAYFQLKEYDLARQEFAQAIQLDDHLSSSYLNLGRTQVALGEIPAAQSSMEKAASIAPLDTHLLLALTYTQFLNHDYPAAIKTAHRAHNQSHLSTAIVHYYAAASWQALNNLQETRNELQTFLTEDPNSALAGVAWHLVEEIQVQGKEEGPPAPPLAISTPVFEPSSAKSSSLGQEVLQDFREKQQIAEAESEGSTCSSCEVRNSRA
jgi:tetratricopeptide (TPR) repeat protein